MAKPAANGFFLASYSSAQLPWMYVLTAVVAGTVSWLYSLAMARFSFLRVNLWTLGICLLSLLLFAVAQPLPAARGFIAIGLYTWVGVFGVLAASQFWMMANLVFDVRQAKRLFGLIGAGAISGGIVGGYLASLLAGTYGMSGLLFCAVLLLTPCLFISWYVWRQYVPAPEKRESVRRRKEIGEVSAARLIAGSRHLQLLSAIIALSVITAKFVEFQFSSYAALRFERAEELTSFFGFWFATFNIVGLILQLFFTHRIFQHFGVGSTLSIIPAGISLSSVLTFFVPGLPAATASRLIDGGLKQSLLRVGIEMLFVPVSAEIKRRVKTYLDVMVDTVAGGFGGLLLLLLIDVFGVPLKSVSLLILVFSLAWLVCTLLMRSEYLNTFRRELSRYLPVDKPAGYRLTDTQRLLGRDRRLLKTLNEVLDNDPPELEVARQLPALIKATNDKKFIPLLFRLVEDHYPDDLVLRKETYRAFNTLQRNLPKLQLPADRIDNLIRREVLLVRLAEETDRLQRLRSEGETEAVWAAREGLLKLLSRRQAGNLSRLFRLLGLRYAASDIIPIYRALTERSGRHRASALELLDNVLEPPLRERVIFVLDRLYGKSGTRYDYLTETPDRSGLRSAQFSNFRHLLAGNDARLKMAVIHFIGQSGETHFTPLLMKGLEDPDERIAAYARRVLPGLEDA